MATERSLRVDLPELNDNQFKMLARRIEGVVIGPDTEEVSHRHPGQPCNAGCAHLNSLRRKTRHENKLRARQRSALEELLS